MVDLIKPSELPAAGSVDTDAALVVDNAGVVLKATPLQVVNAGTPVASEAEALAGVDNSKRMTALRVRQVLDNTSAPAVERAQAWAESPDPPDPLIPDSKSSKTWAGLAEISEGEAQDHADAAAGFAADAQNIKNNLLADLQAEAETLPSGDDATATWDGGTQTITFGIPAGATGATGATGPAGPAGPAGTTDWNGIANKPAVIAAGATQADARTAIGLGTLSTMSPSGTASNTTYLRGDNTWSTPSGGGSGTVTSVALAAPIGLSVSDSPVTTSGTLTLSYASGYQGYTSTEAAKLSGIQAGAEVNVQSDWSAVSGDAMILNKPTLGGAAALNVGTAAGTVAAGNDSRIVGAVQTSRSITAGTGLTGGGNLSADRSLALSAGSIASLSLADTAVQPSDLGDLAYLDTVEISDISATGTPGAGTFLRGDGAWAPASGGGGGTVTSVGLSAPTGFSVSGSPVTGSGTLTFTYAAGYVGYTTAEASKLSGIGAGANVTSVAGKNGVVTLVKGDVGLGNVDNTSDANKPVSTAQQAAIDLKVTKAGDTGIGGYNSAVQALGNSSGQNITPTITTSNFKTLTNNGNFTLTAPANGQYIIAILVTNAGSGAGSMTASGFNKVHGTFATTASLRQLLTITVIDSTKVMTIMDAS